MKDNHTLVEFSDTELYQVSKQIYHKKSNYKYVLLYYINFFKNKNSNLEKINNNFNNTMNLG